MSLETSAGKLSRAAESFRHVWRQVRTDWRDAQAAAFEQKYVTWLESCVKTALMSMGRMDATLAQARRDCG